MPEDQGRHDDGHDQCQANSVAGDVENAITAWTEHHQIGLVPDGGEKRLTRTEQHCDQQGGGRKLQGRGQLHCNRRQQGHRGGIAHHLGQERGADEDHHQSGVARPARQPLLEHQGWAEILTTK